MIQKKEKLQNLAAAFACSALYMMILRCFIPFIYGIVDDRSMMEFVSGQYLGYPDAHTIFMGYWYSLFLTVLYRLTVHVDWYALCFLILQTFCLSLVIYRLLGWCKSKKQKLFCVITAFILFEWLCLQATVQLSFTTTAAVLGMTVIFWYETMEEITWKDLLLLFLTAFITCEIRSDIFYMILPLCGILWTFRSIREKHVSVHQLMIPPITVIVLVLHASGYLTGYGTEQWQKYEAYNQDRTAVYDFPAHSFIPYEGAEDFYESVGIEKKSRARTLMNYNYTADDQITPEFFKKYIETYNQTFPSEDTVPERIFRSVKIYVKGTLSGKFHMRNLLALILYTILGLWCLYRKQWLFLGKTAAAAGIQILLWLCLIYAGRTPDRVIYSMSLMMIVAVLLLWLEVWRENLSDFRTCRFFLTVMLLLVCALGCNEFRNIRKQNLAMAHWNENAENLKAYCMSHPENFYFSDVTSLAFTTWNVRLWRPETYVMNYMSLGDWMSFSPIWQKKLDQHEIVSVKEALYEQDHVYLICSFDKGLEYLKLLYDDVSCEEMGKVSGFHIYKLRIKK